MFLNRGNFGRVADLNWGRVAFCGVGERLGLWTMRTNTSESNVVQLQLVLDSEHVTYGSSEIRDPNQDVKIDSVQL